MNKELAVKFGRASWDIIDRWGILIAEKNRSTIRESILKNASRRTAYSTRGMPAYASKRGTKIHDT